MWTTTEERNDRGTHARVWHQDLWWDYAYYKSSSETRILKFHNHLRCLITTSNVIQEHRTNTKTEGMLIANRSLTWPRKSRRLWQSTARRLSYLGSGWSQSRPLHYSSSISEEESRDQLFNVLTLNDGHLRKYARFRISTSYNSVLKIHACKVVSRARETTWG